MPGRFKRNLPTSHPEIVPLLVGLFTISIPVALLTLAAHGESTIVLVLAVLAMFLGSIGMLTFMFALADDGSEEMRGRADG